MMEFRAALAQIDSRVGDLKRNAAHHLEFVDRAIRKKAHLVVFPELSLTGYTLRDLAWESALDLERDPVLDLLKKRSRKISIVIGCVESGENHGIYNSAVFLEDGKILHVHRKLYPPTYGMFEEGRYFSPGKQIEAFDSKLGRFGMLVCEDFWHLALPYVMTMDGAEALICLTASPTRVGGEQDELSNALINHEHHRTYARLLSSYVLFSNRVGFEDGVNFWGGSAVTGPSGEHLAKAKYFEEDLIVSSVSSPEVRRARRFSRHLLDENPDLVREALARMKDRQGRKR